ncbi:MAG: serine hydrolase [Acidobacteriota bacterium]
MRKVICWIVTGLIVLPIFFGSLDAQELQAGLSPSEEMDKLFDFWNRLDQPGFAVVVLNGGQVVYQKVFGLACQEHGVPIAPDSVFNTSTLAQPIVGQAVAMLEKEGKLSLDDDVRKTIPEIPDFGTPIKLRHLVYQTSGLRDWLPVQQLTGREMEELTFERMLKIIQEQKKLLFSPGDRFQYSNSNYDLLAEAIKRTTGRTFSEWAWESIFKPLKMTRTLFRDNFRSMIENEAFSYDYTRSEYQRGIDTLSMIGSHSLHTSITDLAKWLQYIDAGAAGGSELLAKMFAAGVLNNGQRSAYCYGFNVDDGAGRRQVSQTGTWAGSGANLVYLPDQRFGFAVLSNWDYVPADAFATDIIGIYLPAEAPVPDTGGTAAADKKSVKVNREKLDQYVGDYRLRPRQVFTISRSGDQLTLDFSGQKFPLTALSETDFFLDVADARITFQKNSDGKVLQCLWKGGSEIIAPRVVLVKPTPEELNEFAGTYFNEELDLRIRLLLRGDALVVQSPGQGDVRLAPDEQDRFSSTSIAMPMIIFQRDAGKLVTGFTIDTDAVRDLVFRKE